MWFKLRYNPCGYEKQFESITAQYMTAIRHLSTLQSTYDCGKAFEHATVQYMCTYHSPNTLKTQLNETH